MPLLDSPVDDSFVCVCVCVLGDKFLKLSTNKLKHEKKIYHFENQANLTRPLLTYVHLEIYHIITSITFSFIHSFFSFSFFPFFDRQIDTFWTNE